ncbi:RidA family protein [Pyxidicoccus parkwayensis]|jgi:enamine deaminase RidA (YjgF/YER057c/UK114 family)|uniref:RidA family protein n=1 Tax=Pyxidicoccus parkwayensis TaxID=2813578 RepID=A0ABX7NKW2_9BACT|nr:RidA family protein [Pyxidicoccus parkwaysis]QSQ19502.1 RidA family protein [Pyxidicoccus parkwaysis]
MTTTNLRFINPPTLARPPGYTNVVEMTGPGRTVWVAGMIGTRNDGTLAGDFRAQAVQLFENLKAALDAVGAGFEHVVKLQNTFLDLAQLPVFHEVRDRYVNTAAPPASTALQVSGLPRGALLGLDAVVVLPPA